MLSGLTRKSFSKVAGLSVATLRSWEEPGIGRHGITAKGVSRLVNALNTLDVFCSIEWIMLGEGAGPRLLTASCIAPSSHTPHWSEEESILRDLQSFKANNSEAVLLLVSDSEMAPWFVKGEYVGGSKKIGAEIHGMVGYDCIVETGSGLLLRRLGQHIADNTYVLFALNPDAAQASIQASVLSAAEVVWRRGRRRMKNTGLSGGT